MNFLLDNLDIANHPEWTPESQIFKILEETVEVAVALQSNDRVAIIAEALDAIQTYSTLFQLLKVSRMELEDAMINHMQKLKDKGYSK